jgi:hypothetical protein
MVLATSGTLAAATDATHRSGRVAGLLDVYQSCRAAYAAAGVWLALRLAIAIVRMFLAQRQRPA